MSRLVTSKPLQLLIFVAWALAACAALPLALNLGPQLDAGTRLQGSESAAVEATLLHRFKSPFTKIALLRLAAAPDPRTDAGRAVLRQIRDGLQNVPGVQGVMSYLDRGDALFIAADSSPILIVGLSPAKDPRGALLESLGAASDRLRTGLQHDYPELQLRWTGEAAVNADLRRLSAAATRTAELRVLPISLLLLLIAFRSLTSALLPVLCGGLTIVTSLGLLALVNRVAPVSIIVVSITSMIGLGLSIDYALLIVSRYREVVAAGLTRAAAVGDAIAHAGRTVLVSGAAVAIGFGAMLWVPVSEIRSIAAGGLIVTAVAVLVATSLLPVLLMRAGRWLDVGAVGGGTAVAAMAGTNVLWRRWANRVAQHPALVLAVAGLPLLVLAAQAGHLRTDLPRGKWLPDSADSVRALHEIDAVAHGNFGQIMHVVLNLPAGSAISDQAGWRATSKLVRYFARDPRIQHVWAVTTITVAPLGGPEILAKIPESVRSSMITTDGRAALIELLPKKGLGAADAAAMAREIRALDLATVTGLAGTTLLVGGAPAFNIDYEDAIRKSFGIIAGVVIGATLLVLSIAFRSIVIPLKAVALNLLSVAAAFGAVVLVFQDGFGSRLLGLSAPIEGGFPIVPILVFGIVFGLSMDYEVFLLSRVADARREGRSDPAALIEGLTGMGRVITFAAAIMITIFGGFIFGDFILIKILGFALGVAVLVDATLIRLAVGPALILLAGRWNWWPGR